MLLFSRHLVQHVSAFSTKLSSGSMQHSKQVGPFPSKYIVISTGDLNFTNKYKKLEKCEVQLEHATKAHRGSECIVPLVL
jgi:hypothetical protein